MFHANQSGQHVNPILRHLTYVGNAEEVKRTVRGQELMHGTRFKLIGTAYETTIYKGQVIFRRRAPGSESAETSGRAVTVRPRDRYDRRPSFVLESCRADAARSGSSDRLAEDAPSESGSKSAFSNPARSGYPVGCATYRRGGAIESVHG